MRLGHLLSFALISTWFLAAAAAPNELDRSGPAITLQSVVYQVGDQWHCPLCRQPVENRDRFGMDLKLCLSEWHDVFIEETYFKDKIRYISDEELVASLSIPVIEPALQQALQAADGKRISVLLHDYFLTRPDNRRLSTYDTYNRKYFITIDEFLQEVRADSHRTNAIIRSAQTFYTPERGFTLFGVHWGNRIDFNHTYRTASKWGVHYLSFLDDQINYFLLTRDPQTARAFELVFNQWYDQLDSVQQEPVIHYQKSYDFIWYELGLANRTQKFIDAARVFGGHLSPETHKRLLKIILGSSRWLEQCLEKTPFHPYNWQTHTAFTLSYAAAAFPEFAESDGWLALGKKYMILHLENDIRDDGGYVERTPGYASYMFSVFYRYMMMREYFLNDPSMRQTYLPRLEKFIEYFVLTQTPVGVNAPFNDAARGKDLVTLFKEMSVFFRRGDFLGGVRNELSSETLASLPVAVREPGITSIDFPDSRFVVMRDSWQPTSYYLMLNYGEWQNHTHYDQLDFEIYANGIPIALDAGIGRFGYVDTLHVSWYKHPLAHNMVTINQAVPEKRDRPGYDKVWAPLTNVEFFAATHDGYLKYQKARHRRHVVFAKKRYWLIIDQIHTERKNQEMDFNLHTPCSMTAVEDGFISLEETGFLIKQDHQDAPFVEKIKDKGIADLRGLEAEPSHRDIDWLIFRRKLQGDPAVDRMATLIYPFASKASAAVETVTVERQALQDRAAIAYTVTARDRQDLIIVSDGAYRRFTGSVAGDFTYGWFSYRDGRLDAAAFTDVSRCKVKGMRSLSFKTKREYEFKK
ncbi:hypothetical protein GX408_05505 [bacterium]|nr:hypothetical protein [bacterium]